MITGFDGSIFWDLAASNVRWINKEKEETNFSYKSFERNDRFISIMKAFLSGEEDDRLTSLQEGIESLKLVVAAKYASDNNEFVNPAKIKLGELVA